ncbi:MAG: response regulator transcription factor [Deltaproteobacteria bacterium]|nr:response regulator transcription factor [Deltaproteobacteria bacterium]
MTPFRETPADGVRLSRLDIAGDELLVLSVRSERRPDLGRLTRAERDVLQLMLQGFSNDVIARRRKVAERTVANQVQSIHKKLGAASRAQIAALLSGR